MAAVAQYTADISGSIVTSSSGTDIAYVLTSNSGYTELAQLNGQTIAFSPNVTNGPGPVSLIIDDLGPFQIQPAPGVTLQSGAIIQGTPYVGLVNTTTMAIYLQNASFGNPYNVPLAASLTYWGTTSPNSAFAFPGGQAISRTTYATLFAVIGTTYGAGDGVTTFNLPNKSGRVTATLDPTGTILNGATVSPNGNTLGAIGGSQEMPGLATANLPPYTPSGTVNLGSFSFLVPNLRYSIGGGTGAGTVLWGTGGEGLDFTQPINGSASFSGNAQGGTSTPFPIVQPTSLANEIMRII
jgi:microcystin-dependent protein